MNVAPHVIRLYVKSSRRCRKLISKLRRDTVTPYQRKTLLHQLRKLVNRLRRLHMQLKIAAATSTVALLLTVETSAQLKPPTTLGPFHKHDRLTNPLREPIFTNYETVITAVDFDGDGDMDIVAGQYASENNPPFGGTLRYFENHSKQGSPLYVEREGKQNPFDGIKAITGGVSPALADIDGDGDLDLFLGQSGYATDGSRPGQIEYYRNAGGAFTKQTGAWNSTTKAGNPLNGLSFERDMRLVFVDFDKDGDLDAIVGSYQYIGPPDNEKVFHYYKNDGNGNFTPSDLTIAGYFYGNPPSPAFGDMDGDGDHDMVVGRRGSALLYYLKQTTPGTFEEQDGAWNPTTSTGNPLEQFPVGDNASPAIIDFDGDGNLDVFVADEEGYYKYSDNIINYYRNSGNNAFEEKHGLDNPFDGVMVEGYASPVLIDFDGDGDLDAVIGNKYDARYDNATGQWIDEYGTLVYYRNDEGRYVKTDEETNPFAGLQVRGTFSPQFVDIDEDGDLDIITGDTYGRIVIFRNNDGEYTSEVDVDPFMNTRVEFNSSARLVDIDDDGDLDLFMGTGMGDIQFFRNDNGQYVGVFDEENPLNITSASMSYRLPLPTFVDIDHDGDLDVFYGGVDINQNFEQLVFLENTGNAKEPVFETMVTGVVGDVDGMFPQLFFVDYDEDGDLDSFIGNRNGSISYVENQNPAVLATFVSAPVVYEPGMDPVTVAPGLVLTDTDDDLIVKALVSIEDYQSGEELSFIPNDEITGHFDDETGVLHFNGKATRATYQALLRTVTFVINTSQDGSRMKTVLATTPKNINFAVYDIDATHPVSALKAVNVFVNSPPDINPDPVLTTSGFRRVINLMEITSDVDENLDPELFVIVSQPSSGAKASIEFVSPTVVNLIIDYEGLGFRGMDEIILRACDDAEACTERVLLLEVEVDSGIIVYNAIAPNSTGDNRFMRITGLSAENNVRIFNRWGDKVFEVDNYSNTRDGNVFRGRNDNGAELPSGTYFYVIESAGKKQVTGYLTLKQ